MGCAIFFGPCTLARTWGTRPISSYLCYDTDSVLVMQMLQPLRYGFPMICGDAGADRDDLAHMSLKVYFSGF